MRINKILLCFLVTLMCMDLSVSWCYTPKPKRPRRRKRWRSPCSGRWRHQYPRYRAWCPRRPYHGYGFPGINQKKINVKKYTNAIKGNVIGSKVQMNNGGKNNNQVITSTKVGDDDHDHEDEDDY